MQGLKFLFRSWAKWVWSVVITVLLCGGLTAVACIFNENIGSEDYIYPKFCLQIGVLGAIVILVICGCNDLNNNRLIRSCPIAKELYTKSLPLFIIIMTIGLTVITNGIYFIVLAANGADTAHYSDTLIFAAKNVAVTIIAFSFLSRINFGGIMGIYLFVFEVVFIFEQTGLGLTLPAAVLIFAAAVVISVAASFAITSLLFRKKNFKEVPYAAIR